jgi:hypothetical protein
LLLELIDPHVDVITVVWIIDVRACLSAEEAYHTVRGTLCSLEDREYAVATGGAAMII